MRTAVLVELWRQMRALLCNVGHLIEEAG